MSLTEAAALDEQAYRQIHLAPHDPAADAATLAALARWCERFSPWISLDTHDLSTSDGADSRGLSADLLLDATGLASHFGGEQAMAHQVAEAFEQRGYCARVAMADTPGAAWAVAHYGMSQRGQSPQRGSCSTVLVVPAAESAAVLESLPIRALRLPDDTAALLEQLGLLRIGQLAHLPRESLAARFGHRLLQRWDQLWGLAPEVLRAHQAPPVFHAGLALEHPTDRHSVLICLLTQLIDRVARPLRVRSEGVLELTCRFRCAAPAGRWEGPSAGPGGAGRGTPCALRVSLFQPTAAVAHLVQLVRMQLEQLALPGLVEQVEVEAVHTAPLGVRQPELFPETLRPTRRSLAQLIDRLSSRLGPVAVARPQLEADAQPEHAYGYVPLTQWPRAGRRDRSALARRMRRHQMARPLHLRSPPLPLAVVAVVPDGPPIRFHMYQRAYRVTRYWGPERIETGWWRGRSVRRDYYRVETDGGHWFWIFRQLDDGRWFLHGLFG